MNLHSFGLRLCVVLGLLLVIAGAGCARPAGSTSPLTVSAASSLTGAFDEIGAAFTAETGVPVTFNFAASGQLAQQIAEGAPVDLFASANVAYVDELVAQDVIVPGSKRVYAYGRLTLWTRADAGLRIERLEDLTTPQVETVAIANPDLAPYGHAAREALQAVGIWEAVQPKLVIGENVRQTFQYGETGNVDVVVAPLSLSIRSDGHWGYVPADLHAPIVHALAIMKNAPNAADARTFVAFLMGPAGRSILEQHGLEPGASR